ncbi:Protoporphyrinogen IX oxidase, novel form, HemJ [hydrothermal vent metagenome]|uniref:Protoporphyrinogen IX oxidase, novel form, HemJ n=1 Tax=hydrothermal vent metagenome TaxID=652676 RepID=A0A3B0YHH9_9ZZZZ
MLWVKAFHIIFMVSWFAGLFYLPRLFVYHAMTEDEAGNARFKVMERKLYRFITPFMLLSVALGLWLMFEWTLYTSPWMIIKLLLVGTLLGYHFYCGHLVKVFANDQSRKSHVWYRWFNEFPVLVLSAIVILVVLKPTL